MIVTLDNIDDVVFDLHPGDRVFLRGDLGAGKTTFASKLIQKHIGNTALHITSPTYTYYQKYGGNLYHFDLYRAESAIDIIRTGAQDIFDDESSICIIEWPEIIMQILPKKIIEIEILLENKNRKCIVIDHTDKLSL